MQNVNEIAERLHIHPRKLRGWMALSEDPCPEGDVRAVAAWIARKGLTQSRGAHGAVQAVLADDQIAPPSDAAHHQQPAKSSEGGASDSDPEVGEGLRFRSFEEKRVYYDARVKELKALELEGKLVSKQDMQQKMVARAQQLIKLLTSIPDRYASELAHRNEDEARTLLESIVRYIREEMSR